MWQSYAGMCLLFVDKCECLKDKIIPYLSCVFSNNLLYYASVLARSSTHGRTRVNGAVDGTSLMRLHWKYF